MKLHHTHSGERTRRIALVATVAGALVVTTAGVAAAQNDDAPVPTVAQAQHGWFEGHGPHARFARGGVGTGGAVAAYLGLTTEELRAERAAGTTLAELAVEQGRSVDGLVDVIVDQIAANLAANPNLTEAQRAERLAVLESRVTTMVTTDHEPQQDRLHLQDHLSVQDRLSQQDHLSQQDRLHRMDRLHADTGTPVDGVTTS